MTLRGARMLQWGAGLGELLSADTADSRAVFRSVSHLVGVSVPVPWASLSSPCSLSVHVLCCGGRAHTKHRVFSHAADAGSRSSV